MSEQELVTGLVSSDRKAYTELVDKYQHMVYLTCLGITHQKENAEDLTQEVFLEIHRSIKYFRSDSSLSTWIYRIAINKSLNQVRSEKRRSLWKSLQNMFLEDDDTPGNIPADDKDPAEIMESRENISFLHKAVDSLPENQRAAFVLAKYDGLSYSEIAEILQKPVSAVEALMHRARLNLQKKLVRLTEQ